LGIYKILSNTLIFKIAHPWHSFSNFFAIYLVRITLFYFLHKQSAFKIFEAWYQQHRYSYYNCDINCLDDPTRTGQSKSPIAVYFLGVPQVLLLIQ